MSVLCANDAVVWPGDGFLLDRNGRMWALSNLALPVYGDRWMNADMKRVKDEGRNRHCWNAGLLGVGGVHSHDTDLVDESDCLTCSYLQVAAV